MRNGFNIITPKSVVLCENVKIGGNVIQTYKAVIYPEIFKMSPFRKIIEKLFNSNRKYKNETNDLLQR